MRLGCLIGRLWYLIAYADTTQTRFFLAIVASLWVGALLLPGDSFARPTFIYMAAIAGDDAELKWTIVFAVYAAAAFYGVFARGTGSWLATVINALGLVLFSAVAWSVATLSGVPFPAGAAAHCGIAMAAMWVLIRTHANSPPPGNQPGWLHD